jgi:hypothetical protein
LSYFQEISLDKAGRGTVNTPEKRFVLYCKSADDEGLRNGQTHFIRFLEINNKRYLMKYDGCTIFTLTREQNDQETHSLSAEKTFPRSR